MGRHTGESGASRWNECMMNLGIYVSVGVYDLSCWYYDKCIKLSIRWRQCRRGIAL